MVKVQTQIGKLWRCKCLPKGAERRTGHNLEVKRLSKCRSKAVWSVQPSFTMEENLCLWILWPWHAFLSWKRCWGITLEKNMVYLPCGSWFPFIPKEEPWMLWHRTLSPRGAWPSSSKVLVLWGSSTSQWTILWNFTLDLLQVIFGDPWCVQKRSQSGTEGWRSGDSKL